VRQKEKAKPIIQIDLVDGFYDARLSLVGTELEKTDGPLELSGIGATHEAALANLVTQVGNRALDLISSNWGRGAVV
jgi:hypothetical protein